MSRTVEITVEPSVLLLAWQAPDHVGNRQRWLVGTIDVRHGNWTLEYLKGNAFRDANGGHPYSEMAALGYEGYPAFPKKSVLHDLGVREALMRRLPPRNRSDFGAFVSQFGFSVEKLPSDAALLAYTGAKLPGDGFSVAAELDADMTAGDFVFEIAGSRYQMPAGCSIQVGDALSFVAEPENEHDSDAIAVFGAGCRIGYINRLHAKAFAFWLKYRSVDAFVQRLNGKPGQPKVFALVKVRPQARPRAA